MLALGIDTSTNHGSVGLSGDDGPISLVELHSTSNHVERLLPAVESLLLAEGIRIDALDLIAVATGPGSFTGVRIGMATGKGLSLAARLPLAGFSTLETMALAAALTLPAMASIPLCVVLRAGRGEVYRGLYRCDEIRVTSLVPEGAFSPKEALEGIPEPCGLIGDGVDLCLADRSSHTPTGWLLHRATPAVGATLARRAIEAARHAGFGGFPALLPNYLRLSDAETLSNRS